MDILLIEDNIDHQELISDVLHSAYKTAITLEVAGTLSSGLEYLSNHSIDLLLCDLKLPDSSIENTTQTLTELADAPAIIILTSLSDEDLAYKLATEGIQDYLPKGELTEAHLVRACNYAMERRKLNNSLLKKNEDYMAFCYSLTHDFKNNLWQIERFAERFKSEVQQKCDNSSQLPLEFLDKIFEKVHCINQIVSDLHDYLNLDVTQSTLSELNLNAIVEQAIDQVIDPQELDTVQITSETLPTMNGCASQIQLLFCNLIGNAIKYNDKPTPKVTITYHENLKKFHRICIADNGMGIPEDQLAKIFTPFERLHSAEKIPGSGLGLSIVKQIVQHHDGKIKVSSKLGTGTEFEILLPK